MKLLESTYNNFRCFKQYKIEYGKETTIFIGKNGTGKSSVVSGIRKGLSIVFSKSKNYDANLSTSNNLTVESFDPFDATFDNKSRKFNYPINNEYSAEFAGTPINWSLHKKTMRGGLFTSKYSHALNDVLNKYNLNLNLHLPVITFFSDGFPHEGANEGVRIKKLINQDVLPRDIGYYGWNSRASNTNIWTNRILKIFKYLDSSISEIRRIEERIEFLEMQIDNRDEYDKHKISQWEEEIEDLRENLSLNKNDLRSSIFSKERTFIERKLIEFTKPLNKEFSFINQEFELYKISVGSIEKTFDSIEFSFKDGRIIPFDTLPMGYKRIFSIVLDIAYRSYILNEDIESAGIVLIDEIELHLHPTLQQEVLQRLKKIFPNIQFIVTTHSPLVISNLKADENNKIIKLENNGSEYSNNKIDNVFGIDYNTGLTEVMGATLRKSEIDKLIDSIVILTKFENTKQAEMFRTELFKLVGNNNKYIQAEIEKRITQNKNSE